MLGEIRAGHNTRRTIQSPACREVISARGPAPYGETTFSRAVADAILVFQAAWSFERIRSRNTWPLENHQSATRNVGAGKPVKPVVVFSRLEPIAQRAELVRRSSLLSRLAVAKDLRVVLIDAPAGYGKTTLLTQWRQMLLDDKVPVAWLSLDEDANSPGELVTYLVHTIQRAELKVQQELVTAPIPDDTAARHRLRELLNAIALDGRRFVLMLDEFEHLPSDSVECVVEPLLRWAPRNLQLVLTSRARPPLPLAALKAQELLLEITVDDLRFRRLDIQELFAERLSSQEAEQVSRLTEGWPVAVQLLRGWWQDSGQSRSVLSSFSGLTDTLADYLSEQVFRTLPSDLQTFLVEMSVLDRLSLGAAEFLTGRAHLWHTLLADQRIRPFLMAVEGDIGVYRLHHVVRQFLQSKFPLSLSVKRQRALHVHAAKWYARARQLSRAVRHALLAGDHALAGRVVLEAGGVGLWIRQGMAGLKAIDALLDDELLAKYPRLALLRALVLTKDGSVAAARRMFNQVKSATKDFTVDYSGGDVSILHREGHIVEGTLITNECRTAGYDYLATYQAIMDKVSEDDHLFQANAKNFLCISMHQRGLFSDAHRAAQEAIRHYRHDNLPHGEFFSHLHIGAIHFATGKPAAAESDYERAAVIARRHFREDRSKIILLNALKADLAYERNQIDLAARRSATAIRQLRRWEAWFDIYAAEFGSAAMTALERQGLEAALEVLARAEEEMNVRQAMGLEPFLIATRMSCHAIAGSWRDARDLARRLPGAPESCSGNADAATPWREREALLLAFTRLAVAEGRPRDILPVLDNVCATLLNSNNLHMRLRLSLMHAAALETARRKGPAVEALVTALTLARKSGYLRVFFEDRCHSSALLASLLPGAAKHPDFPKAFATELLDALEEVPLPGRSDALTPRELDVLRELRHGQSDKVIAQRLDVSGNTVKFHLKNIYSKLKATGRVDAIHRAREAGLLD